METRFDQRIEISTVCHCTMRAWPIDS